MDVGAVMVIGISVVFFSFGMLYLLFRVLAKAFAPRPTPKMKQIDTASDKPSDQTPQPVHAYPETADFGLEEEEVAAIMAVISAMHEQPIQLHAIYPQSATMQSHQPSPWRNHRHLSWHPKTTDSRKGVGFQ